MRLRNPAAALAALAALLPGAACSPSAAPAVPSSTPQPAAAPAAVAPAIDDSQLVDLTHELSPDSLYWPNGKPFQYQRDLWGLREDGKWYAMGSYATPEHLGTHLDAPIHFAPDGWTTAEIPLQQLIGPAVVIDIVARADSDPDTMLQPQDIDAWEREHGTVPAGAIVLVRTGWSTRWPDWNGYYGSDDPFDTTTLHFPGVSPAAAEALASRAIAGVGIDTASIDPGDNTTFDAHRVLGAANIFNLENLTGLEALPAVGATVLALPIKIAGGTGGQARVVAMLPR